MASRSQSGADTLVTLYHGCTREMGKFASERLVVRHYISVLAEALGVSKPDRFSTYWRLGEPHAVMEASRPNWSSWGYSEEQALGFAHKYFVPSYAVNAPECPCNGACTSTGGHGQLHYVHNGLDGLTLLPDAWHAQPLPPGTNPTSGAAARPAAAPLVG